MASDSLAKTSSKLNHSRRHLALIQDIIIAGSRLAVALNASQPKPLSKNTQKAIDQWSHLMVKLVNSLL